MISNKFYKTIPEYNKTMYLDGYSPEEILESARRKTKSQQTEPTPDPKFEKLVEQKLDEAIDKALTEIFKGFK